MTDDVLPELLKLVCDEFEKSYAANGIVKQVQKKLEDKSATYADAYEYAYEVGCMLSDALTKHVTNQCTTILLNGCYRKRWVPIINWCLNWRLVCRKF